MKQPDGGVEVLESMTSEIPQRLISDERRGRGGDDHLAAVGERSDPGAAVDIDPDVALRGHGGCAGVQTHSHGDRPRRERPLPTGRSGDRPGGGRKGDEERIPLGVDLHTPFGDERIPQEAAVLGERLPVGVRPELLQEAGGALDVSEQERHRPRGQVPRHARSIADDVRESDGLACRPLELFQRRGGGRLAGGCELFGRQFRFEPIEGRTRSWFL